MKLRILSTCQRSCGTLLAGMWCLLVAGTSGPAVTVSPDEMRLTDAWMQAHVGQNVPPPISFYYDGKPWRPNDFTVQAEAPNGTSRAVVFKEPKTGLQVRLAARTYGDFPTVEWTVYFQNKGTEDTPVISEIQALDTGFQRAGEGEFVLHHWAGSQATIDDYRPFETKLVPKATQRFASSGGRGSDGVWPYFNLDWGRAGVLVAVGWPGQWAATFTRDAQIGLQLRAGQGRTHFRLRPGEEVRTPLIVLQFWQGGDWIRAQNIWRQWMLAHNLPRLNGVLPAPLLPASSANQLSEMQHATEANQKAFIDGYIQREVHLDFWWMDAGWYEFKEGWWNVGTWQTDRKRFPNGLRAVSDFAHQNGVRTLLWFEPERVTPGTWLYVNHPEWLLGADGKQKLLDLGNPNARQWVVEHVDKVMAEEGIDIYRQDFNFAPLPYWEANDTPDRQGISEIRHVTGYLAFWDELRRRNPGRLIDTCASGGRRNDLETLRRSVPLHKSDMEYPNLTAKQTQLAGLAFWVPYFGAPVYPADRVEVYGFRSGFAPMTGMGYDVRQGNLDDGLLRRLVAEWRQVAPLLIHGDYYPLTRWSSASDVWLAYQFDRPTSGEGVVQAFRRPESPYESAVFKLSGLDRTATYELKNCDLEVATQATGDDLMQNGLHVMLTNRPAAVVIFYRKRP